MSDVKKEIKAEALLAELRQTNQRLAMQLKKAKLRNEELVEAVYRAAKDAASMLEIDPVPVSRVDTRKHTPETAIAVVSDLQLGKRTPTYSVDVCERRMKEYADKVRVLTEIQRSDHSVNDCRLYLLGDIIESEDIFPDQPHRIDASLYRQIVVDGPRIIVGLIRSLLAAFPGKIRVVCCVGNHGRLGRFGKGFHPESNGDLMLYRIVQQLLSNEPRVEWLIPETKGERSWYAVDQIGDHKYFVFHGDQMRGGGFGGLPYYGFARAINNWASGVIPEGFRFAFCGHWHQAASIPINDRTLWINGSTESGNEWLREELKVQCSPSQWLLFAHPKRGVTCEYRVWLT